MFQHASLQTHANGLNVVALLNSGSSTIRSRQHVPPFVAIAPTNPTTIEVSIEDTDSISTIIPVSSSGVGHLVVRSWMSSVG